MSDELKTSAYDKLTPQRKLLVNAVLKNLEKGTGLWEQGWSGGSAPVSAITGKSILSSLYNLMNDMLDPKSETTKQFESGLMSDTPAYLERYEAEGIKKLRR